MSRTVTPTAAPSAKNPVAVPHDKIAMRAYEKWCRRGCPHGADVTDWLEAETELRVEMSRTTGNSTARR